MSLPNTLVSSSCWANGRRVAARLRAWARREFLIGDVVEQVGRDRPIGERRHVLARLQQREVTRRDRAPALFVARWLPIAESASGGTACTMKFMPENPSPLNWLDCP